MQEIFQRTMRSRLESFKSAKMGVAPPKHITKHPKKDQQQKVRGQNQAVLCPPPSSSPSNMIILLRRQRYPPQTPLEKNRCYYSGDEGL